jgi:hypothetical protein
MSERGVLVRKEIPAWLDSHAAVLGQALGVDDFFAEGSNGAGRNARVPWTRFASRFESPKPTEGFYVVYLFDAAGRNVYLSLNQGTTDHLNGELVRKPPELILERSAWARAALGSWLTDLGDRLSAMSLNGANLGDAYEDGSVAAIGYERDAIPDDTVILADAKRFAEGLGLLYREHNLRPLPKEQPEIHEAEVAADRAAGNRRVPPRAGFRANAAERKAIEKRAIDLARAYYMAQGFKVKELGKPFDLEVRKDGMKLTVEVKGTTSDGSGVVLTANEVEHHAEAFPDNALVIVRNIALGREGDSPSAGGGHLYELRGWEIDPDHLRTISYAYEVPATMYNHVGVHADELL